ncbi:MAG: AAA family ATPase, partial [Actinoplanes sp.]
MPNTPVAESAFEVLEELGRGAQAVVHHVRRDGTDYAMKLLLHGETAGDAALRAVRREVALLASVQHPGLARVHEVGTLDGRPYVLMDLVSGRRLTDVLAAGRMAERDVLALGAGLAEVLAAAHRKGVVHRDVNPGNVLIEAGGAARLIDFGLAARVTGAAGEQVAGTLAYSAPEQAGMLHRPVDGRSDLYGLGAVLFECATGRPPYAGGDLGELLRLHAVAPVPDPRDLAPELSPAAAGIIRKLLAKDPDDRYQSGAGLLADLRRAAEPGHADFPPGTDDEPAVADEAPFVGRRAELAALAARWQDAGRGRGGVILVQGPPGGGKSRLVRELAGLVASGQPVLAGNGTRNDVQPFAALRTAFDAYVRGLRRLPAAEAEAALAGLRAAAGENAPLVQHLSPALAEELAAGRSGEVTEERYVAAVAGFLGDLARRSGGALLHLDDAQWCDEATLRVLDRLAAVAARTPLLVVVTARDDAAGELRDRLGDQLSAVLDVEPLDAAAVSALVTAMNGGLLVDPDVAARLAARSHGNPFTVLEYVQAIVDAGLVRVGWGAWSVDAGDLDALELPADAAELILQRVDALDGRSRRVLGLAAVVGYRFAADVVAEAGGLDRQAVLDVLREATRQGLVETRDDESFAFLHDRIREALEGQLDDPARRALHDRIAALLERRDDPRPAAVYAIARHRIDGTGGHDPAALVRSCRDAGRLALAEHAPESAVFFLEHAARVTAGADPGLDRLLGRAYHRTARLDKAAVALRRAAGATKDPMQRARTLHMLGRVHESGWNSTEQIRVSEEALKELGQVLPRHQAARLLSSLGWFIAGCLVWLTRIGHGTAAGRTRDRYRLMCALYQDIGAALVRDLRPRESLPYALRAPLLAARVGRSAESVDALNAVAFLCRTARLHKLADRLTDSARQDAAQLADPPLAARVAWLRAVGLHGSGRDSGESMREVIEKHDRWLDIGLSLDAHAVVAWDGLLHGDMAELRASLARARRRAEAGGQSGRSSVVTIESSHLALQGRATEAAAHLARMDDGPVLRHARVDVLIATLRGALESADTGETYERALAEFDELGLSPQDLLPAQKGFYVYRAYGEIDRCRTTPDAVRLAAARAAVAALGKVAERPLVVAHHRVTEAAVHLLAGDHARALAKLDAAAPLLRSVDAPLVAYEAALVAARALRAARVPGQALREARAAVAVAEEQGWPHRARRIVAEFGLHTTTAPGSAPFTAGRDNQRWAALRQISLAASRVLDPARLARTALDETIRILGAERAFLILSDDAAADLGRFVGRDAHGNELTDLAGHSASLVERIRADRQAVVVTGTEQGEAFGSRSMVAYGLRSIVVAPLLLDDRLLGVVYLDSRVAKGMFTADDVETLTAITHHVAVSLETARTAQLELAVASANQQRDLAETLRQAMTWFTGTLDPDELLGRALASLGLAGVGGQACVVLGRPGADTVVVAHLDGAGLRRDTVAEDPEIAALLDATGIVRAGGDAPWAVSATAMLGAETGRPASWLAAPLVARGEPLGVLLIGSPRRDAYPDADVEI